MATTILQWIEYLNENYASCTAFQYVSNDVVNSVSYREYVTDIKRFATYLKDSFLIAEDVHFGILARNSYDYAVALCGIILAKGVAIPLNFEETAEIIQNEIHHADVEYLFVDREYEDREPCALSIYRERGLVRSLAEYRESEHIQEFVDDYDIDKLAIMLFTSGTTGKSKAAMMSQRKLFAPVQGFEKAVSIRNMSNGNFCVVPMYHISGIGTLIANATAGTSINMCNNLKYMYRDLKMMRSTYTLVVPVILKAWAKEVKRGHVEKLGDLKVIICGAADVDEETLNAFGKYGISVFHAYALTEITGGGTMNASLNPDKMKSVGKPMQGCEVKIIDGEVCLKSEAVFCGYYKAPEETAAALKDGWLHTGDLGYLDEEGYLYLTGRKKNLIILSSGENVRPEELEELIARSSLVEEVLVEARDGKIWAKIVAKSSNKEQIQEEIKEMNRGLAHYKRISQIEFCNEPLPKTATGKILRR